MKKVVTVTRATLATCLVAIGCIEALSLFACADSSEAERRIEAVPREDAGPGSTNIVDAEATIDAEVDASDARYAVDAAARICSDEGFCHSVVPAGHNLRGVWGDGLGVVWAVSAAGGILRWDGDTWSVHATVTGALSAVWGSGPTDVWIVGAKDVFHGTGETSETLVFQVVSLPGDTALPIKSIGGTGPNDIWAFGGGQGPRYPFPTLSRVAHYGGPASDGASDWTLDGDLSSREIAFTTVWGNATAGVWATGTQRLADGTRVAPVLRRANSTTSWETVPMPPDPRPEYSLNPGPASFVAASMSSESEVWLIGQTGLGNRAWWRGVSTDNAQTYAWTFTPMQEWDLDIKAVWGIGVNDSWEVGPYGKCAHWDGVKWNAAATRATLPITKDFYAIWGTSNDDFWIVGDEMALHKTKAGKP